MATPATADSTTRKVYFPEGDWYDLYSEKQYQGGKSYKIEFPMDQLPLFAKAGSIIPLAEPLNYIANDAVFNITCKVFGNKPSSFALWEDDGTSFDFEKGNFNQINLSVEGGKGTVKKDGKYDGKRYVVNEWNFVK